NYFEQLRYAIPDALTPTLLAAAESASHNPRLNYIFQPNASSPTTAAHENHAHTHTYQPDDKTETYTSCPAIDLPAIALQGMTSPYQRAALKPSRQHRISFDKAAISSTPLSLPSQH